MTNKWQKFMNIVCLALLLMCFVKIRWMENELSNIRNNLNSNYSMLRSDISFISNNIRYELEQQASLISDSGFDVTNLNIKDKTAVVDCYVVPKTYSPQQTSATILCNGVEYPMTLENGRYTANITFPITEEVFEISSVSFTEDNTIRTQKIGWQINPKYDLIPTAYIYYSGSMSQDYGETITRKYQGSIDIDFEHRDFVEEIKDVQVYMIIDGKEVWRDSPEVEVLHKDDYMLSCRADIQQNFELKRGSTILMIAEITDNNGWKYRSVLEDATIGEKGNPIPNRDYNHGQADVCDAEGNIIFKGE